MAYLPVELALKIPEDILYYKIQLYLSSPTAEIIKEVFNAPLVTYEQRLKYKYFIQRNPQASNLGFKYMSTVYKKSEIQGQLLIFRLKRNKKERFYTEIRYSYYPLAGFDRSIFRESSPLPNMKWTQPELYMLSLGLVHNAKKGWSKRKLLQALYPNLHFGGGNQGSP